MMARMKNANNVPNSYFPMITASWHKDRSKSGVAIGRTVSTYGARDDSERLPITSRAPSKGSMPKRC